MKIKVESDVFDIVNRIKDIDEYYFILYDTNKNRYELHNSNQKNSYCFTYPYETLDVKFIEYLLSSHIKNIDNIIDEIDRNNSNIEKHNMDIVKNQSDYMLREIYSFSNNSSKKLDDEKAFSTKWR